MEQQIAELAEEIAAVFPRSILIDRLQSLSVSLPGLLEAFAFKLGYDPSNKLQMRLMYLVYRYKRYVSRPQPQLGFSDP